jgi:hypothetical protein
MNIWLWMGPVRGEREVQKHSNSGPSPSHMAETFFTVMEIVIQDPHNSYKISILGNFPALRDHSYLAMNKVCQRQYYCLSRFLDTLPQEWLGNPKFSVILVSPHMIFREMQKQEFCGHQNEN